jgi:hypothetical protein
VTAFTDGCSIIIIFLVPGAVVGAEEHLLAQIPELFDHCRRAVDGCGRVPQDAVAVGHDSVKRVEEGQHLQIVQNEI